MFVEKTSRKTCRLCETHKRKIIDVKVVMVTVVKGLREGEDSCLRRNLLSGNHKTRHKASRLYKQ